MIRNLKVLLAAAMALMALGAVSATGAQAAEESFHCEIEKCTLTLKKDGTGTTAHHVFVLKGESKGGVKGSSVSFTCEQLTGTATTATKTFTEVTFDDATYHGCKIAGEPFTVDMNTCSYLFTSKGGGTAAGAEVHLECTKVGDGITLTLGGVSCLKVTPLTTPGIKYKNLNEKTEITAEVLNLVVPIGSVHLENTANVACAPVGLKTVEEAKYTTGHTIVEGETDVTENPVMKKVWFE